jgi:hypothetical protein
LDLLTGSITNLLKPKVANDEGETANDAAALSASKTKLVSSLAARIQAFNDVLLLAEPEHKAKIQTKIATLIDEMCDT